MKFFHGVFTALLCCVLMTVSLIVLNTHSNEKLITEIFLGLRLGLKKEDSKLPCLYFV